MAEENEKLIGLLAALQERGIIPNGKPATPSIDEIARMYWEGRENLSKATHLATAESDDAQITRIISAIQDGLAAHKPPVLDATAVVEAIKGLGVIRMDGAEMSRLVSAAVERALAAQKPPVVDHGPVIAAIDRLAAAIKAMPAPVVRIRRPKAFRIQRESENGPITRVIPE